MQRLSDMLLGNAVRAAGGRASVEVEGRRTMARPETHVVREEVLNIVLAELLSERGLLSVPETVRRSRGGRRLPDVLVADLHGVRVVIEGRVGESGPVRASLTRDATARVEEGIAPICLAVAYPSDLRRVTSTAQLRRTLTRAPLQVRVFSENGAGEWAQTNVDGVARPLRIWMPPSRSRVRR
jgi:hypothetical protein